MLFNFSSRWFGLIYKRLNISLDRSSLVSADNLVTPNIPVFVALLNLLSHLSTSYNVALSVCFFLQMAISLILYLSIRDIWHSWSPQEQSEYQECDKNSTFGKLG